MIHLKLGSLVGERMVEEFEEFYLEELAEEAREEMEKIEV